MIKQSAKIAYKNCNKTLGTTTVGELITYLSEFSGDLPIIATWEGTYHGMCEADLLTVEDGIFTEPVLCFEVEFY